MNALFVLKRPIAVTIINAGVEREEHIRTITAEPSQEPPDLTELEARASIVRSATKPDGSAVTLADVEGFDVGGGLREAYRNARARARGLGA